MEHIPGGRPVHRPAHQACNSPADDVQRPAACVWLLRSELCVLGGWIHPGTTQDCPTPARGEGQALGPGMRPVPGCGVLAGVLANA
eukprot:1145836-Pelagomonas_calceolata.AAC.21